VCPRTGVPFGWFPLSGGARILSGKYSARSAAVLAHLGSLPAGSDVGLVSAAYSGSSREKNLCSPKSFKVVTGNLEKQNSISTSFTHTCSLKTRTNGEAWSRSSRTGSYELYGTVFLLARPQRLLAKKQQHGEPWKNRTFRKQSFA
jgi:hypothetical protein